MCYLYNKKYYNFDIYIMGIFYFIFALISAYLMMSKIFLWIPIPIFIVSIYNFYNRIVSQKHPYKICFKNKAIQFYSKSKIITLNRENISKFHIKQYAIDVETYIWIKTKQGEKHKVYINLSKFEDNIELRNKLLELKTN